MYQAPRLGSNRAPKSFFWLGLVLVFLIGLLGGAYLVLRSTVTHGELANSSPLSQGKSSDELLAELLKINQGELGEDYVAPEDKNLTENFLNEFVDETGISESSLKKVSGSDFVTSTVLPYLKSNQLELFPFIPDSVLNIVPDSKSASQKYFKDTNADMILFFNGIKEIKEIEIDEELSNSPQIAELEKHVMNLAQAFENISKTSVPKNKIELHKKIMMSVYSLQKTMESIINSESDPLKSLLVVNNMEAAAELWQETLYDYVDYPQNKRK